MVFREDCGTSWNAGQRAHQRHAVVQRLLGTGLVQVYRELVTEREQLQRIPVSSKEIVAQRPNRGDLRQLFQTQDLVAIHLLLRGTHNIIINIRRHS